MKNKKILILAIETSCDETSVAVVADGNKILSNIISSQIIFHQKYGGVVPELASRKHIKNIMSVVEKAIFEADIFLHNIDAIGVTYGPGLVGALLVGVSTAKALAYAVGKPIIGVNHIEGHIFSNFLNSQQLKFPFVALVVSGGHTALIKVIDYNHFHLLGQTRDDAAGEVFDKIARVMNLSYPGGPEIEKLAKKGNNEAIFFPRAMINKNSLEFSFSGIKSLVINYINNAKKKKEILNTADIAASFQEAIIDVLVKKTILSAMQNNVKTIALAGGVAANKQLQKKLCEAANINNLQLVFPTSILCTDNAAMIGCRAYYKYINGLYSDYFLNAVPNLNLN